MTNFLFIQDDKSTAYDVGYSIGYFVGNVFPYIILIGLAIGGYYLVRSIRRKNKANKGS